MKLHKAFRHVVAIVFLSLGPEAVFAAPDAVNAPTQPAVRQGRTPVAARRLDRVSRPRAVTSRRSRAAVRWQRVGSPSPAAPAVDLNTATLEQLQNLPGVGPDLGARIMAGRPYRDFQELAQDGIPLNVIDGIRPLVTIGP